MTNVFVTGAEGFIGSHLVEELVRAGYSVRALVLYNSFDSRGWLDTLPADVLNSVEIVTGDVRDAFGIRALMKGCDAVLHLAALIGIPYSYQAPEAYVATNVSGTLNVLQAARELELQKVVHTSTSEVYGSALFVPITEGHPLQGQSPYSASKIGADQLAFSYFTSFGLPVATVRPFNTYGPRQSTRAVIPTITTQVAAGASVIQLGALTPTRDFTFVTDTARGFRAALESEASAGQVVNIGTGFEISIEDLARTIVEISGRDVAVEQDPARMRPQKSEVDRLWAATDRAEKLLGWTANYSGMEGFRRGLEETFEWFSDPANLVRYRPGSYAV
jgi:NAD dependent epimerase/dehydratase